MTRRILAMLGALVLALGIAASTTSVSNATPQDSSVTGEVAAKKKVCTKYPPFDLVVKGITCKKGKKIFRKAANAWDGHRSLRVGKFRCRFPYGDLTEIKCKHVKTPKKKWVRYVGE